jgi:CubicO group peptidase (beta-lactamase class C family)
MATVRDIAACLLILLLFGRSQGACAREDSGFRWQAVTPEDRGMSSAKLDALRESLAGRKTVSFLVIRDDRIVYEWYAKDRAASDKHGTASLAKAVVGGMALAVDLNDGRVRLDDPVSKIVTHWGNDPWKSRITVRQLGSHTSGLSDAESDGLAHERTDARSPPRRPPAGSDRVCQWLVDELGKVRDALAAGKPVENHFRVDVVAPDPAFSELLAVLRLERERLRLSLGEVARRTGIDTGDLSRLENGKVPHPAPAP